MSIWSKVFCGLLLLTATNCFAQCPENIGFEDGSFNNWICYAGTIDNTGTINVTQTGPVANRHVIIDSTDHSVDPYGNFPIACPNGGRYSVRLGNDDIHSGAERVTYAFTVPPGAQYTLIFDYAVVLQNPSHQPEQQPKFTAQIYDVTDGRYIDCPSFDFIASSSLPGFKLSTSGYANPNPMANSISVYYKEWATAAINLTGYAGKNIRLEFTTNDCSPGGHFGYAYIDVNEQCGSPITGNNNCIGQDNITTLFAPGGFSDYFWYTGDLKQQVGHGQTLTLSPSPPNMTKYALILYPYPGLGCIDTLYTQINKVPDVFNFKVVDTLYGCTGSTIDLTAPSVTAGSSSDLTYTYYTDPVTLTYAYNPKNIATTGLYYIRGVNPEGCMNILPVQVMIGASAITVTDPSPVVFPATINLISTYKVLAGYKYTYYSDVDATIPIGNIITKSGTYYIKAISKYNCSIIAAVHIVIDPPPPYVITMPNTFTPNNDGINDYFSLKLEGYVDFNLLSIFNRNGQLLFTAKSIGEYWDGTYNGKQLPAGTYYWVFNGTDSYYHTKFIKSGYIAIIR
jgi:gliding motility-associated-like protein